MVTSEPVQREIVADLERTRPRVIVRDTSPRHGRTRAERGRPPERRDAARRLHRARYREVERHGALVVLVRR